MKLWATGKNVQAKQKWSAWERRQRAKLASIAIGSLGFAE